ncbi:MAG TPA: lipoprotein [Rhodanobacteraceae bacterium]|nr:lipoprotein [Rhodanobacteraceae bacterium]
MRRIASAIFLTVLLAALAGCGQKGPLVRPNNGPASGHSAPPPPAPTLPTPLPDDGGIG